MIIVPTGYADAAMFKGAGTPYGASHVAALTPHGELSEHESALARALGTRVAFLADRLATRP